MAKAEGDLGNILQEKQSLLLENATLQERLRAAEKSALFISGEQYDPRIKDIFANGRRSPSCFMINGLFARSSQPKMKVASKNDCAGHIPTATKCSIALQAISRHQTITAISKHFHCSRTTIHEQKNRALEAAASAFVDPDDQMLFTIPVATSFIRKMVVGLCWRRSPIDPCCRFPLPHIGCPQPQASSRFRGF